MDYYSSGELAKITGVTKKTLRYYHDIGLLEPDAYKENGYKQYSVKSVEQLQKILMLKYLQFPLDEIKEALNRDNSVDTFAKQEELIISQIEHLNEVLKAVKDIQNLEEKDRWQSILSIIKLTMQKEELTKQYKTSENLQNRINIHKYSTSDIGWYEWLFDRIQLESGMRILEIGCGTGQFWVDVYDRIPENVSITMTDKSKGMLETAKQSLLQYKEYFAKKNIKFQFLVKDAEDFTVDESSYDRILANHMLYHISNDHRPIFLKKCKELLTEGGMFCASTVGEKHLKELFHLIEGYDDKIQMPNWMTKDFQLENGGEQLSKIFSSVEVDKHDNDLLVPDYQAIINYIMSMPGSGKDIIKKNKKEVEQYFSDAVKEDKPFFITKSTGMFKAIK